MSKHFSCSHCGGGQKKKRLFALSNISRWRCPHCNTLLKPKPMSPYAAIVGFLAAGVPAYYLLFIRHLSFWVGMGVGALCGVLCYLLSLVYFYYTVKLEEADF